MDRWPRRRPRGLEAGRLHEMLGITFALDTDLGGSFFDPRQFGWRQFDIRGCEVFLKPMQFGRARDRNDPRLMSEEPCESNLGRRGAFLIGDRLQKIDQRLVFLHRLWSEAWQDVAEVTFAELRILVHRAC